MPIVTPRTSLTGSVKHIPDPGVVSPVFLTTARIMSSHFSLGDSTSRISFSGWMAMPNAFSASLAPAPLALRNVPPVAPARRAASIAAVSKPRLTIIVMSLYAIFPSFARNFAREQAERSGSSHAVHGESERNPRVLFAESEIVFQHIEDVLHA